MIYVHNLTGRNIYTKLDDVLEIHKPNDQLALEGYEKLGKAVNSNYQTYTQRMMEMQSKHNVIPYKRPGFVPNSTTKTNMTDKSSVHKFMKSSNVTTTVVSEKSKEEKFLNFFTHAIKINSDIIKNSDNVVNEINKNFTKKPTKGEGFNEMEVKADFKVKYQKEDQDFMEKINAKVERNKKIYNIDSEQEHTISETQTIKGVTQKRETNMKSRNLKKRLKKTLFTSLSYLYDNNIPLVDFYKKNPFQSKPFTLKYSFEFFEAVKFNRKSEVEELLKKDKAYLFEIDYFHQTAYHWAAKRGYADLLELLISKGNHINQYDNHRRTPLYLAAMNNHKDACDILIKNEANPFMETKEGKKPSDVATDDSVRMSIHMQMEKKSEINGSNYFKLIILKKFKDDLSAIMSSRQQNIKNNQNNQNNMSQNS